MQSWHVGHEVDNQSQEEELIDDTILTKNVSRILQSWHVLCVMTHEVDGLSLANGNFSVGTLSAGKRGNNFERVQHASP